jgi:putative hydrolase of the HAD superfamily
MRPRAILLDLDDTILDDSSLVHECWREACVDQAHRFAPLDQAVIVEAIRTASRWYWGDADRHRTGRLELEAARREVVSIALTELGIDDASLAAAIGDAYSHRRDAGMEPLPEAIDTVRWLRDSGRRLALLTNGAGPAQRKKVVRFGLADFFDVILIEGEMGFGKPDERVYHRALTALDVSPSDAWMVGDNLEWDVAAPQKLGIAGIWIDLRGRGVPEESTVRPEHVVKGLSELRSLIENPSRPLFL